MSDDAAALARVAADLVAAGISSLVAPTPARAALARIRAGEDGIVVIKETAADWLTTPLPDALKPLRSDPQVVTKPAERRKVLSTTGRYTLKGE